jgi:hypothetical protein
MFGDQCAARSACSGVWPYVVLWAVAKRQRTHRQAADQAESSSGTFSATRVAAGHVHAGLTQAAASHTAQHRKSHAEVA